MRFFCYQLSVGAPVPGRPKPSHQRTPREGCPYNALFGNRRQGQDLALQWVAFFTFGKLFPSVGRGHALAAGFVLSFRSDNCDQAAKAVRPQGIGISMIAGGNHTNKTSCLCPTMGIRFQADNIRPY